MRRGVTLRAALLIALVGGLLAAPGTTSAQTTTGDSEVSVGSPDGPFSQNKQNEPSVAIDANHPNVVVAGANDNIDMEACNVGDDTTCPFTPDVGVSGIYFSFDSGHSWNQPTYTGWTARDCLGEVGDEADPCEAHVGPIGTLPKYYENGLVSDGDPAIAFGPVPDANGEFSWDNGSRLYYVNLAAAHSASETVPFKGFEAIAVSRTDDVEAAAAGDEDAWYDPVIASKQSSATFSDKEQVWADNAASSPFFGNAYICFAKFNGSGAAPLVVATSRDGGDTWRNKNVSPAHAVAPSKWGQSGCTVRTDSEGVVYVFYEEFQNPEVFFPPSATHFVVKSFDGGVSWTRPMRLWRFTDVCAALQFDGSSERCVEDGVAGARSDLAGSPTVSIANGAPTGENATDELILSYVDASDGTNNEHVMVRYSTDGTEWSDAEPVERAGDRGYYTAPAISPDGTDVYLVYNAFTTPFRDDTTSPRGLVGVVLAASVGADGAPTGWAQAHRGEVGDPRASSQNNLVLEFLGDYVYAAATDTYGVAVWNDVRDGTPCDAINEWRAEVQQTLDPTGAPEVQQECDLTFGNTDIFGWTSAA